MPVSLQAARTKLAAIDRTRSQSRQPTTDLGIPEIMTTR